MDLVAKESPNWKVVSHRYELNPEHTDLNCNLYQIKPIPYIIYRDELRSNGTIIKDIKPLKRRT